MEAKQQIDAGEIETMKVLVVDDSKTIRKIIINCLKDAGYNDVVEAENGKEALEKLEQNDGIGMILTDWNMPEMDGLSFVKAVRAQQTFKAIPIMMITTEAVKEDVITAIKAGVNNYLTKPFTPKAIKEKINKMLQG